MPNLQTVNGHAIVERVRDFLHHTVSSRRRTAIVAALAATVLTGAVVGVLSGGSDKPPAGDNVTRPGIIDAAAGASFSRCPGEPAIGQIESGDAVVLTGRTEDGAWLELQAPDDAASRVWMQAPLVGADQGARDLPIRSCATTAAAGGLAISTGNGSSGAPSGSGAAAPRGSQRSGQPATTIAPTATTTTTTTAPTGGGETDPPDISGLRAGDELVDGPDQIFDGDACGPTAIAVEALAVDSSGIRSVTVYWSYSGVKGAVTGSTAMQATAVKHRAILGPFPAGSVPGGASVPLTWWVEATDNAGNTARADAPTSPSDERITLSSCPS